MLHFSVDSQLEFCVVMFVPCRAPSPCLRPTRSASTSNCTSDAFMDEGGVLFPDWRLEDHLSIKFRSSITLAFGVRCRVVVNVSLLMVLTILLVAA